MSVWTLLAMFAVSLISSVTCEIARLRIIRRRTQRQIAEMRKNYADPFAAALKRSFGDEGAPASHTDNNAALTE